MTLRFVTNEELDALIVEMLAQPKGAKRVRLLNDAAARWEQQGRSPSNPYAVMEAVGKRLLYTLPQRAPDQIYLPWRIKVKGERGG